MIRTIALLITAATATWFAGAVRAEEDPESDPPTLQHEALFGELDENSDGSLSAGEVPDEHRRLFDRLLRRGDRDSDGQLTREEFLAVFAEDRPDGPAGDPGDRPGDRRRHRFDGPPDQGAADRGDRPTDRPGARRGPPEGRPGRPEGRPERRPGGPAEGRAEFFRGPMMGVALMRALDTDGDGKLSGTEISDAASALKKLDKNDDGEIGRDELMPPQLASRFPGRVGAGFGRPDEAGRRGPNPEALFNRLKQFDKDGDGKIKKDELPGPMQARFEQLDQNDDGILDEAELKEMLPRLMRRFGEAGPPGGPDRPPRRSGRPEGERNNDREERKTEES